MGIGLDLRQLPVIKRVQLLVNALDGAEKTNEALSKCSDGEQMVAVLLGASSKLGLALTRKDLMETPPIRDWIWWKNKEALVTIGDNKPRYKQDNIDNSDQEKKKFLGLF